MRTSQFPLNTVKETPADAEIISHQLMLRAGIIRNLARGLYDYPKNDSQLGLLAPSIDAVARALSLRHAIRHVSTEFRSVEAPILAPRLLSPTVVDRHFILNGRLVIKPRQEFG